VAGVVRLIVWDGVHVAACVGRAVCAFCRPSGGGGGEVCRVRRGAPCGLCLACSLCFFSDWRWQGWCGLSRVHAAACVWRAVCAFCRRRGGRGGSVCPAGWCARCGLCLACSWCFLSASRWQRWFGLSGETVCTLGLVFGVHLVLFVGVAVANLEVDMVAGVVRYVPWDGVQVAACVWRAPGAVCRRRGGSGGSVCPAGLCARWGLCLTCTSCCLSASRWQGWFSLSRGTVWTVCKLRLVFGVHLVPFVGVAVANVEVDMVAGVVRFVRREGVHLAACVCRAAGDVSRRGGGGRGAGRGGGGVGAVCSAGWLARSDASCVWGVVEALRVGTSRRTRHVTTTSG